MGVSRRVVINMYDIHSSIGAILGLLIFVVSFSGTVVVLKEELEPWARNEWRRVERPGDVKAEIADLISSAMAEARLQGLTITQRRVAVLLPGRYSYPVTIALPEARRGKFHHFSYDPYTGEKLPDRDRNFLDLLRDIHADLLLPHPYGRYAVGFLGIALMLMIVTGVVMHRKIFRDFFTFRPRRSARLLLADMHKVFGVWGLLFHAMIAYTGVLLALKALLLVVGALVLFKGDTIAAGETIDPGFRVERPGQPHEPAAVTPMLARVHDQFPDVNPFIISITNWGHANASVEVLARPNGYLAALASVVFRGSSGEIERIVDWRNEGVAKRVYNALLPLHYATYGGIILKLIYVLLGAGSSMMAVTGLLIWLERRQDSLTVVRLRRLLVGVCAGMLVATASMFCSGRFLSLQGANAYFLDGVLLFSVWIAGIGWALVRSKPSRAARDLLLIAGALLCLAAVPARHLFDDWLVPFEWRILATNSAIFLFGCLMLLGSRTLRSAD